MARRKEPHIADAILDQLLSGTDAKRAFDQGGLLDALKKALAERALNAEMDHQLAGDGGTASRVRGQIEAVPNYAAATGLRPRGPNLAT